MKVLEALVVCSALAACGCAGNRAFGSGASAGSGRTSVPDSSPSLGLPTQSIPQNSSSYGPSGGGSGPSLGFPEAWRRTPAARSPRITQLEAPPPKQQTVRKPAAPLANPVSSAGNAAAKGWNRYYRSTDGQWIESAVLGSGPTRIAITASMHGDEVQSVGLVDALAKELRQNPESLKNVTVLLIRCPNPDGFAGRTPYNVHGVDLNRNFPSPNWQSLNNSRAGSRAASETETRVVVRLLNEFQPGLLVHLKDSRGRGTVNYEGQVQPRAEQIASLTACQVVQGLGEKTSGSVENYAQTQLKCPSLTVLLPREADDAAAWEKNRESLLTLFSSQQQTRSLSDANRRSNSLDDQPDPFEEPAVKKSSQKKALPASRGAVAGSTTSMQRARSSKLPAFPSPVPDQGYVELPPP